jgi:glutamate-ammonia-ligase adenylyltransferase
LSSYAEYYARWSLVWEAQALLRASPVAGDPALGQAFMDLVEPIRYPAGGLSQHDLREIRRIKARVESERLPRGVEPQRHLKLGPGGLADIEWSAQLLQLQHAAEHAALRTTGTVAALRGASGAGVLGADQASVLIDAWVFASRLRNAVVLWRGRATDVLPNGRRDLEGVARLLGYPAGSASQVEEDLRRRARRARTVVEEIVYG